MKSFFRFALVLVAILIASCDSPIQPTENSLDPKSKNFDATKFIQGTWEVYQTGGQNKHTVTISAPSQSKCTYEGMQYTFDKFQDNYIHYFNGTTLTDNLMFRPLSENSMLIDLGHPFYNFDSTWIAVRK